MESLYSRSARLVLLLSLLLPLLLPSPALATCTIAAATDIALCNTALAEGETDIHVAAAFTCEAGIACTIRISNRTPATGWITVRGEGHQISHITNASGLCQLPVIWVENSNNVLLKDIGITETHECGAGPSRVSQHDGMGVGIGPYSSHVLVTGMWIESASTHGIAIGHSDYVAVWNNDIVDARTYGIVSFGVGGTQVYVSNRITGSGDAGIAAGSSGPDISIAYNNLLDNHLGLSYGFGGGQLLVEKPATAVVVEHNVLVTSEPFDLEYLDVGIELAADIQDVAVRNNILWNPTRVAIHWHGSDSCASRKLTFSNNAVASPVGQPPTYGLFHIADTQGCGTVATQYFYAPKSIPVQDQTLSTASTSSSQSHYPAAGIDWLRPAEAALSISVPSVLDPPQ